MSGVTDPIADMLTRVRNAHNAGHDVVMIPPSNLKVAIARTLKDEGFIRDFDVVRSQPHRMLRLRLVYTGRKDPVIRGLKRVSKPGRRVYAKADQVPKVLNGLGVAILTTPKGIITDREARKLKTGGEVLCYIW